MIKNKLIAIDHVYIERREIEETGEYDLGGTRHWPKVSR